MGRGDEPDLGSFWKDFDQMFQEINRKGAQSGGVKWEQHTFRTPGGGTTTFRSTTYTNETPSASKRSSKNRSKSKGIFEEVFDAFWSAIRPSAQWSDDRTDSFLPAQFQMQPAGEMLEDNSTICFNVLGEALEYGQVRQMTTGDSDALVYVVDGRVVARGERRQTVDAGLQQQQITFYDGTGTLLATAVGPPPDTLTAVLVGHLRVQTPRGQHLLRAVRTSLFGTRVRFSAETESPARLVAVARRSPLARQPVYEFQMYSAPEGIHNALFPLLLAFLHDDARRWTWRTVLSHLMDRIRSLK